MRAVLAVGLPLLAAVFAAVWFGQRGRDDAARDERPSLVLRDIGIALADGAIDRMERALQSGDPARRHEPGGDRPFFDAVFAEGGVSTDCEVSLLAPRAHHDPTKPSLRIKWKKSSMRDGVRRVDLYRPDDVLCADAVLLSRFAEALDVMHDARGLARVSIDGVPHGVYHVALPSGLAMTNACRRLEGTFVFGGPGADVWLDAGLWKRFGRPDTDEAPIAALLSCVSDPDADRELEAVLDLDAAARWAAVRAVLGRVDRPASQSAMFFCSVGGRFEPIAWSFDGERGAADADLTADRHPLVRRLAGLPSWRARRDAAIRRLLDGDASRERWGTLVADLRAALERELRGDPRVIEEAWRELETWIDRRRAFLLARLGEREPEPARLPDVVLGPGEVVVDTDVSTTFGQVLRIVAGTHLRIAKGSSLLARGPLLVEGSERSPVTIRAGGPDGLLAVTVLGPGTAGSRVVGLDLEGASAGPIRHGRAPAGLVVHDCPGIEFRDCRFGPTATELDSVHVSRSTFAFERCRFEGSRRDGLDVAFAEGSIVGTRFRDVERNAIDLSSVRARVETTIVDGAGRAALSAGEASRVEVVGTDLARARIGVDARDDARVWLRKCRLQRNRVGVRCERVDWRYARGGHVALELSAFEDSQDTDLVVEKRGRVVLVRTDRPRVGDGKSRVETVRSLPDGWLDAVSDQ